MRNLLALAAAALIAFVVVGWFLGWYQISATPTNAGREYKVDINSPKISEDISKGKEKLREVLDKETSQQPSTSAPQSGVVPGVPASYQRDPSTFVYPGSTSPPPVTTTPVVPTGSTAPRAVPPGVPQ